MPVMDEDPIMTNTVKRVKALLGKKKLHISVRKALYDQELSRYLRQRKERMEKPVRVEVANRGGAQVMVSPRTRNRLVFDETPGTEADVHEEEDVPQLPLARGAISEPETTPRRVQSAPERRSRRQAEKTEKRTRKETTKVNARDALVEKIWAKRQELGKCSGYTVKVRKGKL